MTPSTAKQIIHHFGWGARTYQVEIQLPREIKQIPTIEQAVKEGYVPYQIRAWPIPFSRWTARGVDEVRNTCKGWSAVLSLDELDISDSADAYVPSGIDFSDTDVPRQMIISFLYFR